MGKKYTIDEDFFMKWTPNMAYVLGFIYADGNITGPKYNRGSYLNISSTDLCIIEQIKETLKSDHIIQIQEPSFKTFSRKIKYILHIGSNKIYKSLEERGLYPHKSLSVSLPKIPEEYLGNFTRGYFDGDGCVYLEKNTNERIKRLKIIFTSGSKNFLISLEKQIRRLWGTSCKNIYNSHRSFQLVYGSHDSYIIFSHMYVNCGKLYLPRKYSKFMTYFSSRKWPSGEVVNAAVCKTATHRFNSGLGLKN